MSYFAPMRLLVIALLAATAAGLGAAAFAQGQSPTQRERLFGFFYSEPTDDALTLLLPLSGSQAAAGQAIRDGFMAAAAAAGDYARVYDSGSDVYSAVNAFELVLRRQPPVIVGPLHKGAVEAISRRGHRVPWLALNYIDDPAVPPSMMQYGLSPEDEARSIAEHARARGLRRALALVPLAERSDWGERALQAFSTRLRELGGEVIEVGRYPPSSLNFSAPVKQLLGLDASADRQRALAAILGTRPEFEPRRRDDADFLFIAARAEDGRLLWPQLRFHRVGDLPAYSTSAIYSGRLDQELNGLHVCDMPFMTAGGALAKLRADAEQLGSVRLQPRLFAFGYDAYSIAARMRGGEPLQDQDMEGVSGRLRLSYGSVARAVGCAEMRAGRPAGSDS
jgi:uncharacterized protein